MAVFLVPVSGLFLSLSGGTLTGPLTIKVSGNDLLIVDTTGANSYVSWFSHSSFNLVNRNELAFWEDQANGVNSVGFKAPASIANDVTWVLPAADGSSGQVLSTDGAAGLGWISPIQLEDSTSSTSITTAATPNAVKSAYDLANAALPKSGGTMTGDITFAGTQTFPGTGSGTVTSVDVSGGTGLTSSGGPITSSGTITVDLDNTAVTPGSYTYASITVDQQGRLTAASNGTTPLTSSDIGVTVQGYDADTAKTDVAQSFSAAQRGSVVALTDGATITPDFAAGNNFSVTLAGNRTLANPTNITAGQSGVIVITQDGTGSRTLSYGSNWKFAGGTDPVLSTAANAVDALSYYCASSTLIIATLLKDLK